MAWLRNEIQGKLYGNDSMLVCGDAAACKIACRNDLRWQLNFVLVAATVTALLERGLRLTAVVPL
jgi:hypothetical protein